MNYWGITDKGIVRRQNQDIYLVSYNAEGEIMIAVVCDGMGGAKAGNIASKLAAEAFLESVRSRLDVDSPPVIITDIVRTSVDAANTAVYEMSQTSSDYEGMGTTLVAAVITPSTCVVANVGDSRAYHVNRGGIVQISRDHSVVEDLVETGNITRAEASIHPNKNLITRALGVSAELEADIFYPEISQGDFFLLCTDGLTNVVSDQEILFEVIHGGDIENCCGRMLDIAIQRGAPDNITALLLEK